MSETNGMSPSFFVCYVVWSFGYWTTSRQTALHSNSNSKSLRCSAATLLSANAKSQTFLKKTKWNWFDEHRHDRSPFNNNKKQKTRYTCILGLLLWQYGQTSLRRKLHTAETCLSPVKSVNIQNWNPQDGICNLEHANLFSFFLVTRKLSKDLIPPAFWSENNVKNKAYFMALIIP